MKKFDELFEKLSNLDIIQTSGDWAENLPDDIWNEYVKNNFKEVAFNLYIDTHRWYEVSVTIIRIYDELLGIEHITNLFSESSNYEDCYVKMKFYRMKEIPSVSYEKM